MFIRTLNFLAYLVLNWWQAKLAPVVAHTLPKFGLNFSSFDSYHDGFFLPSRSQLREASPKLLILCKLTPCPTPIAVNKVSSFSLLWLSPSVITVHFIMSSLSVSLSCLSPDFSACFSGLSNAWVYILAWGHFSRMLKATLPALGVRPEMPGSYSFPPPAHRGPQPVTLGSWSISSNCFAFRCNDSDMCCFTPFPTISLYRLSSAATHNNWFNNILFMGCHSPPVWHPPIHLSFSYFLYFSISHLNWNHCLRIFFWENLD